jgi:hypothetical protein
MHVPQGRGLDRMVASSRKLQLRCSRYSLSAGGAVEVRSCAATVSGWATTSEYARGFLRLGTVVSPNLMGMITDEPRVIAGEPLYSPLFTVAHNENCNR